MGLTFVTQLIRLSKQINIIIRPIKSVIGKTHKYLIMLMLYAKFCNHLVIIMYVKGQDIKFATIVNITKSFKKTYVKSIEVAP